MFLPPFCVANLRIKFDLHASLPAYASAAIVVDFCKNHGRVFSGVLLALWRGTCSSERFV
jgi:hypothetical protein